VIELRQSAAAFIFLVLFFMQSMAFGENTQQESEASKRGQIQFRQSCSFCHGADATGSTEGPNLLRSRLVRHDQNGDLIGPVIRDGRPAKGMPAVQLSEGQISDVVAFIHWRVIEGDRTSPDDARNLSLKQLLTGNAGAGEKFFNGPGGCTSCHSPSRDLAHIARKYSPAELQARLLYPSDVPKTVTITTRSGEEITGELLHKDAFSIAVRDHDGWYRSWNSSDVKFRVHNPVEAHLELLHKYTEADMHNVFAYLETLQ